ncbi:MAG: hypothetical protein ACOC44_08375 [Promethearchaeia archaeon]
MSKLEAPKVVKIIDEDVEISDELDYALMKFLINNRGSGYTACQPKIVELSDGQEAIQMDIDNTFVGKDNQLMGLGIVGKMFIDVDSLEVLYCTSKDELEKNIQKLETSGVDPQPRPKGKY